MANERKLRRKIGDSVKKGLTGEILLPDWLGAETAKVSNEFGGWRRTQLWTFKCFSADWFQATVGLLSFLCELLWTRD